MAGATLKGQQNVNRVTLDSDLNAVRYMLRERVDRRQTLGPQPACRAGAAVTLKDKFGNTIPATIGKWTTRAVCNRANGEICAYTVGGVASGVTVNDAIYALCAPLA
jgi:hypothetical protein